MSRKSAKSKIVCANCGSVIRVFVGDPVLHQNTYPLCTKCNSIVEVRPG